MQIIWRGQSCFQLITSQGKNHQVNLVTDPFDEATGLKVPKLEADVLLVSHQHDGHNNLKAVSGNPSAGSGQVPFLVSGPGEYDVKGIYIQGIPAFHDATQGKDKGQNTIYTIEAEDLRICHLGDFGQKELTDEQLEKIGDIDILMIPVGGVYTISAKEAVKIMSRIEPKIIIPMHYQIPKLKLKLDGVEKFLKTMGVKKVEPMPKLVIKKKDILPEEVKIVVLKP